MLTQGPELQVKNIVMLFWEVGVTATSVWGNHNSRSRQDMSVDYIIHLPCRWAHKVDTHNLQCRLHYPFSSAGGSEKDFLFQLSHNKGLALVHRGEEKSCSYKYLPFSSGVHISCTKAKQWPTFKKFRAFCPLMLAGNHFAGSLFRQYSLLLYWTKHLICTEWPVSVVKGPKKRYEKWHIQGK